MKYISSTILSKSISKIVGFCVNFKNTSTTIKLYIDEQSTIQKE